MAKHEGKLQTYFWFGYGNSLLSMKAHCKFNEYHFNSGSKETTCVCVLFAFFCCC